MSNQKTVHTKRKGYSRSIKTSAEPRYINRKKLKEMATSEVVIKASKDGKNIEEGYVEKKIKLKNGAKRMQRIEEVHVWRGRSADEVIAVFVERISDYSGQI